MSDVTTLQPPDAVKQAADEHEALLEFVYVCPHGLTEFDRDGAVLMMNPACARMLLPTLRVEDHGAGLSNILDALAPFAPDLRHRLAAFREPSGLVLDGIHIHIGKRSVSARKRVGGRVRSEGQIPFVLSLTVLRLTRDRHMAVLADVSDQVAQQRRLDEAEAWFSALSDGADGYAFFGLDAEGRVSDWNSSAQRLFGLEAAEALGVDGDHLLTVPDEAKVLSLRLPDVQAEGWQVIEGWMQGAQGARFWGTSVISAMQTTDDHAMPSAFLAVVRDMTERRDAVQELRRALCQDHLTGLLNRRRFFELAEIECNRPQKAGARLSVIMIDADHFKAVNDIHGHSAGDVVLRRLADLLRSLIRDDTDLVGRLGGEEFAVLLPGRDAVSAMAVADRLRGAIAATEIEVTARDGSNLIVRLTASFGVAERSDRREGLEALLAAADVALYAAKAAGRNRVRLSQSANM